MREGFADFCELVAVVMACIAGFVSIAGGILFMIAVPVMPVIIVLIVVKWLFF